MQLNGEAPNQVVHRKHPAFPVCLAVLREIWAEVCHGRLTAAFRSSHDLWRSRWRPSHAFALPLTGDAKFEK